MNNKYKLIMYAYIITTNKLLYTVDKLKSKIYKCSRK